jgi:hypothetical protein
MTFLQRTFFDAATLTAAGFDMKFQVEILVYWRVHSEAQRDGLALI